MKMATAILRPHHCHKLPFHPETLPSPSSTFHPRRNPNSDQPRRRKRSPVGFVDTAVDRGQRRGVRDGDRSSSSSMVVKFPAKNLVMERVTILKRGEEMKVVQDRRPSGGGRNDRSVRFENEEDSVLCSTDRLGPEPEMVQKQIRVKELKVSDVLYAGSVSFSSPPPSSVPFPAFFAKHDAATTDLRRLLRLDLL